MLEKQIIQYIGFRNTYDENGEATGFEFRMRLNYYRGVWLSQLRLGSVIVDGETYTPDCGLVTWVFNGVEYTPAEAVANHKAFWARTEACTVRVKKPGGLAQGYHDVKARWGFSSSYMPPFMDHFEDNDEGFAFTMDGGRLKSRKMLMV